MSEFWNNRYGTDDYAYGTVPNEFFKSTLQEFNLSGKILLPAEGEGRNAVFAAKSGLDVTAFDISIEGKNKALKLARAEKVNIEYLLGGLDDMTFMEDSFDAMGLIYAHFPAHLKSEYHKSLSKLIKVGGLVILEAFSKNNIAQKEVYPEIGGPPGVDMLFSVEEIKIDFKGFEIIELKEKIIDLNEGLYHKGMGSVVRFIGKKL